MKKYEQFSFTMLLFAILFSTLSSCKESTTGQHQIADGGEETQNETTSVEAEDRQKSFMITTGNVLDSTRAGIYTRTYYKSLPASSRDNAAKSIYFEVDSLESFKERIRNSNICTGKIGFRFYFAKYPDAETDNPFKGQQTIIVRATCDGEDIAHNFVNGIETPYVAYNFGDVCPPRCNLGEPNTKYESGGEYRTDGNCRACP